MNLFDIVYCRTTNGATHYIKGVIVSTDPLIVVSSGGSSFAVQSIEPLSERDFPHQTNRIFKYGENINKELLLLLWYTDGDCVRVYNTISKATTRISKERIYNIRDSLSTIAVPLIASM